MTTYNSDTTLASLLACCCDNANNGYERAWWEFERRYGDIIFKYVKYNLATWDLPRLNLQFDAVIDDIYIDVFVKLTKRMITFQMTDSEAGFRSWLFVVCRRTVRDHVRKYFKTVFNDNMPRVEPAEVDAYENYQELFEIVSRVLRKSAGHKKDFETRIQLFYLYCFYQFDKAIIQNHPCFKAYDERKIENEAFRLREILREKFGTFYN